MYIYIKQLIYIYCIGGSRGGVLVCAPLQDPILSFSHTFSLKSAHIGGQNPPKMGPCPPYRKSWIRPCIGLTNHPH